MKRALLGLFALAGCDLALGLEQNKLLTDGPVGACDGPSPLCDTSTPGVICGRILGSGADAATPIQTAAPTGNACDAASTEGPCAYSVGGMPMSSFFAGSTNRAMGTIDDCGRYVVPTLSEPDIAVVLSGPDNVSTGAIARARMVAVDVATALDVVAVGDATKAAWASQVPGATFTTGYLVLYSTGDVPRLGEQVTLSGSNPIPTTPSMVQAWAAYFSADGGFGTIDPAATMTSSVGTAFVAPIGIASPFTVEGLRPGRRCMVDGLQVVNNTLVLLEPTDC